MQNPAVTGDARAIPLTGPGPSLVVRGFWLLLAAGGCLLFAWPLTLLVPDDVEAGLGVAEALWLPEQRALAIAAAITMMGFVAGAIAFVVTAPRARARREVVVEATGLRFVEHPHRWFAGRSGLLAWSDVALVSAPVLGGPAGMTVVPGAARVLAVYLQRRVSDLPGFAAPVRVRAAEAMLHDLPTPSYRVPVAATQFYSADDVSALAEAIGTRRPELFRASAGLEQWYLPPATVPPAAEAGEEAGEPQPRDVPAAAEANQPPPAAPSASVWLDHGHSPAEVAATILVQVVVVAGCLALMANPFDWPSGVSAAVTLVLVVPLLFCCLTLPATLWILPRHTAGVGILVNADGFTVRRKQRWRPRATTDTFIDWARVQAVVDRQTFQLGTATARRRAVDVYLHDDRHAPVTVPGVGVDIEVSHHDDPDFPATPRAVRFPATRLRLTYRHDLEPRGRGLWTEPLDAAPAPRRVPAHQLRPALLAIRPDLCRGFSDLWSGRARR